MGHFKLLRCVGLLCLAGILASVVACSRDPEAAKAEYIQSADRYVAAGKLDEAIVEYLKAVEADPQDGELRLELGEAYAKTGQGRQAAEQLIRAADLLAARGDVQVQAGSVLLMSGRFDDAKVRAEKALALDPANLEAQILLANALAGLKDLKAAVAELEEAIKLDPARSASYTNLGAIELSRGRQDAAERAFKKAIDLDARSAAARLALGNFFWATGRTQNAEEELRQALALEPDNPLVLRTLASFAMSTNRLDEAERHLRRVVDITKSREAAIALADFYIVRSNEEAARGVLEPLVATREAGNAASIRLAALDHAANRKAEAYRTLDAIIAGDRANLQALLVKTSMLLADGRPEDARAAAETAVRAEPGSASAHFLLGRAHAALNQPDAAIDAFKETMRLNPRATAAQVALSQLHLVRGRPNESLGFAQEALVANPDNPEARVALVRALVVNGDITRAQTEVTKLSATYPDVPAVRILKGMVLSRLRDTAGARREFEAALERSPTSLEALGGLVALDLAARQPDAALERVKGRASQPDASPALLMLAARTFAAAGDVRGAEGLLRRVIEKDARFLNAYSALGQLYLQQGRLDQALQEFESLAGKDPKPVAALTLAGIILQAQGRAADARTRFERVLQVDSNAPVAANNLAWMIAESGGNLDVALQLAQTAHRGLPESPEVSNTLGFVYYKKSLYTMAIPPLKASVDKDPSNPAYHLHLGLAYAKSGNSAAARQYLQRALTLRADVEGAAEAREVLAALKSQG